MKTNDSSTNQKFDDTLVQEFDLTRYMGKWYEIARLDHRFERGLNDVTAEYSLYDNGMVKVVNSGFDEERNVRRTVIGKAKETATPGLLRVSFFWIFYSDYRILALGDNYEWALVASGRSHLYFWILSRISALPNDLFDHILDEVRKRGYDPEVMFFPEFKE